jgi:hypothetical protein
MNRFTLDLLLAFLAGGAAGLVLLVLGVSVLAVLYLAGLIPAAG